VWILEETGAAGALTPAAVFIDGTHIKASSNLKKKMKREVPAETKRYQEELLAQVNPDRETHRKKPLDDGDETTRNRREEKGQLSASFPAFL